MQIARNEGIHRVNAEILSENAPMVALAKHFHFELVRGEDLSTLTATLRLNSFGPAE